MQKESIDLMNVEYEDVLQLYRGWRKSESALKDKNKELAALKSRITQLQDSHVKFRGQIQSLDSVKELTVTLQNQLSVMEQENRALGEENLELAQLNVRADELLREKETQEENQTKMLREVQMDVATLRGRYEEATRAHKEVEKLAADEQALRLATESRFNSMEDTISALRDENRELREQLDSAAIRMSQCDQEMLHASEQLGSLSKETSTLHAARQELSTKEAELALIKGDISRLLRLMEHSPATRGFLAHWQDSGGMDFVGIDRETSAISHEHSQHRSFEDTHHGLFNSTAHENTVLNSFELNPTEFAHLKRIHGGDPFPITTNLAVCFIYNSSIYIFYPCVQRCTIDYLTLSTICIHIYVCLYKDMIVYPPYLYILSITLPNSPPHVCTGGGGVLGAWGGGAPGAGLPGRQGAPRLAQGHHGLSAIHEQGKKLYICMYVCMYVCIYMYVCMYVFYGVYTS